MAPVLFPLLLLGLCMALSRAPLGVRPSTVPTAPGESEGSQASPGGEAGEQDEVPKVDLQMVPDKRWKTSRRALLQMKHRFSQFIHDEIRKVARDYMTAWDRPLPPHGDESIGKRAIDIYEEVLQGPQTAKPQAHQIHPALKTRNPARFQQISEHGQLADETVEAAGALHALFDANKMGMLLDTQQDVSPTEYLTALAEALQQRGDPITESEAPRTVEASTGKPESLLLSAHRADGAVDIQDGQN